MTDSQNRFTGALSSKSAINVKDPISNLQRVATLTLLCVGSITLLHIYC